MVKPFDYTENNFKKYQSFNNYIIEDFTNLKKGLGMMPDDYYPVRNIVDFARKTSLAIEDILDLTREEAGDFLYRLKDLAFKVDNIIKGRISLRNVRIPNYKGKVYSKIGSEEDAKYIFQEYSAEEQDILSSVFGDPNISPLVHDFLRFGSGQDGILSGKMGDILNKSLEAMKMETPLGEISVVNYGGDVQPYFNILLDSKQGLPFFKKQLDRLNNSAQEIKNIIDGKEELSFLKNGQITIDKLIEEIGDLQKPVMGAIEESLSQDAQIAFTSTMSRYQGFQELATILDSKPAIASDEKSLIDLIESSEQKSEASELFDPENALNSLGDRSAHSAIVTLSESSRGQSFGRSISIYTDSPPSYNSGEIPLELDGIELPALSLSRHKRTISEQDFANEVRRQQRENLRDGPGNIDNLPSNIGGQKNIETPWARRASDSQTSTSGDYRLDDVSTSSEVSDTSNTLDTATEMSQSVTMFNNERSLSGPDIESQSRPVDIEDSIASQFKDLKSSFQMDFETVSIHDDPLRGPLSEYKYNRLIDLTEDPSRIRVDGPIPSEDSLVERGVDREISESISESTEVTSRDASKVAGDESIELDEFGQGVEEEVGGDLAADATGISLAAALGYTGLAIAVLSTIATSIWAIFEGVALKEKAKLHRIALAKEDFDKNCDCIGINNYGNVNFGTYCDHWESTSVYFIKTLNLLNDKQLYVSNDNHGSVQLVFDTSEKTDRIFELVKVITTLGVNKLHQTKLVKTNYNITNGYYAFRNPLNNTKYLSAINAIGNGSILETTVVDANESIGYNSIFFVEYHNGGLYKISIRNKDDKIKYYVKPNSGLVDDGLISLNSAFDDSALWKLERTTAKIVQSDSGWCFIKNGDKCKNSFNRDQDKKINPDNKFKAVDSNGVKRWAKKCDACSCRSTCISDNKRWGVLNRHWCPVRTDSSSEDWKVCSFISRNIDFKKDDIKPDVENWRFCGRDTELTDYSKDDLDNLAIDERTKYLGVLKQYDNLPEEFKAEKGIFSKQMYVYFYKLALALNYEFYEKRMLDEVKEFVLKEKIFKSNSLCDLDRSSPIDGLYFIRDPRQTKYYLHSFSTIKSQINDSVHMVKFSVTPHFFYIRKIQKIEGTYYYNIYDVMVKKAVILEGDEIRLSDKKFTSWILDFDKSLPTDTDFPYTTCLSKIIKYRLPTDEDSEDEYLGRIPNYELNTDYNLRMTTTIDENIDWQFIKLL